MRPQGAHCCSTAVDQAALPQLAETWNALPWWGPLVHEQVRLVPASIGEHFAFQPGHTVSHEPSGLGDHGHDVVAFMQASSGAMHDGSGTGPLVPQATAFVAPHANAFQCSGAQSELA